MPVHRHPVAACVGDDRLRQVPLDRELIDRLRASYATLRAQEFCLAETFYSYLFAAAPGLRPMFPADLTAQTRKLTAALDAVVRNLEVSDQNAEMLAELGARHAGYGAKAEHYAIAIDSLIAAMRELLGSDADARVLDEWRTALGLVSDQMIAAGGAVANASSPPGPPARP